MLKQSSERYFNSLMAVTLTCHLLLLECQNSPVGSRRQLTSAVI